MPTIDQVQNSATIEYSGENVIINDGVGKDANILIKDGNLHIKGSVAAGTNVKITVTPKVLQSGGMFGSVPKGVEISMNNNAYHLDWRNASVVIDGDVGDDATIECGGAITVKGKIGKKANLLSSVGLITVGDVGPRANIKNTSGSIIAGTVGESAKLKSISGSVACGDIADDASAKSVSGNVRCGNVGESASAESVSGSVTAKDVAKRATASSVSGNVNVVSAHETSKVESVSGQAYVNGVRKQSANANSFSIGFGGVVFGSNGFFSGGNSFRVVNVREVLENKSEKGFGL